MSHLRFGASIVGLLILAGLFYVRSQTYTPPPVALHELAARVLSAGRPDAIPADADQMFGLGDNAIEMKRCRMEAQSGDIRGVLVRQIEDGYDVVLVHETSSDQVHSYDMPSQKLLDERTRLQKLAVEPQGRSDAATACEDVMAFERACLELSEVQAALKEIETELAIVDKGGHAS